MQLSLRQGLARLLSRSSPPGVCCVFITDEWWLLQTRLGCRGSGRGLQRESVTRGSESYPRGGCRRQNGGRNGDNPWESRNPSWSWPILAHLGQRPTSDVTSGQEPEPSSCSNHRQGVSPTAPSALTRPVGCREARDGASSHRGRTQSTHLHPDFPRFWPRSLAHQST